METFRWPIRPDLVIVSQPRVSRVRFGDGYEQRRPDGLHADLKIYSVTLVVSLAEGAQLEAFFARHGGVDAFRWTPPYGYRPINVLCRQWRSVRHARKITFTADFEQVVA
ncbi:phage tail protein [Edwardsiella tarda]|uniref:phage tail protein n=1 Tax=Edwardsiella tarda TaxID=636 RepID=UPI0039BE43AE